MLQSKMIKVYGSELCPDCVALKASLDLAGVDYTYVNIMESMVNFKAFLSMRDHNSLFDVCRENGSAGIPVIEEEDGTLTIAYERWLMEHGIALVPRSGQACSLDGKGC